MRCAQLQRFIASRLRHWQASQSGLSIEQNLMSLAGASLVTALALVALCPPAPCIETAFIAPGATVDFSAYVALVVRR
jgi:hypothetical protein